MSKKLIQAAKVLYSSRKKTPLKDSTLKSSQNTIQNDFTQLSPFVSQKFPQIETLLSTIQKQIVTPINLHTEVFNNDQSHKCLAHNQQMNLFCINDQKPLCALCMYQGNTHKVHKVIPIAKAKKFLQSQIKEFLKAIQCNLQTQTLLLKLNSQNLVKIDNQYPIILERLHKFYLKLQQIIIDKKNQMFKSLHNAWSRTRQLNGTMKLQISRINHYTKQKLTQINQRKGEDYTLLNFNVAFQLTKLQSIVHQNLCEQQPNRYFIKQKKFQQIQQILTKSLNLYQVKPETLPTDISNLKLQRKTSKQFMPKQKSTKSLIKNHQELPNQNPQQSIKLSKNRHSKLDIQSTRQLKQKKLMLQQKITRQRQETLSHSRSNASLSKKSKLRSKSSLRVKSKTPVRK